MLPGTGLYTPAEAAALLHEQPETVRRWAFGYRRNRAAGPTVHPPLIHTDLPELEGQRALTFVELVELLYIRAFHAAGASWHEIKEAATVAARLFTSEHPFALRQVYVDPGRVLYGGVQNADGSESFIRLRGHGQHELPTLVKPFLDQLDFDLNDVATRWWPLGRNGGVVIDPAFSFGAPRVEEAGIRTRTLAQAVGAEHAVYGEKTVEHVAWTYEISPRHVETALAFEQWLEA
ncbi:hypothetical protein [Longimicrobium sp.]|uniref:hypothetical protein n=1 Tax=Longimicrobium sp. TaxID=2029185 RepID=UPI003B3BC380